jgi:hypothetical protein
MILHLDSFNTFESLISDDIEFVLIDFQYVEVNSKVYLQKQFIPISSKEAESRKFIETYLSNSMVLVIYDKERYKSNTQNTESIVKNVLSRKVAPETYNLIMRMIENKKVDISSYQSLVQSDTLVELISNTISTQHIFKKILLDFKKLNTYFLEEPQLINLLTEHEIYKDKKTAQKMIASNKKEDKELLKKAYKKILKDYYMPMESYVETNIREILNNHQMEDALENLFFHEDGCLLQTINYLNEEFHKKMFNAIFENISNSESSSPHKNAKIFLLEILREIKYVNLYSYDEPYNRAIFKNAMERLYKSMTYNTLKNIDVNSSPSLFLREQYDNMMEYELLIDDIKEKESLLVDEEIKSLYHGDIEAYEEDMLGMYLNHIYGADTNGVTVSEIKDSNTREHIEAFKEIYIYEQSQLELEFLKSLYSENDAIIDIDINTRIPTTKLKHGKYIRLTKAEHAKLLKVETKKYLLEKRENESYSRSDTRGKNQTTIFDNNELYKEESVEKFYLISKMKQEMSDLEYIESSVGNSRHILKTKKDYQNYQHSKQKNDKPKIDTSDYEIAFTF